MLADDAALAEAAAKAVGERALLALAARGRFRVAFPGGRTPRGMLERLAASPWREQLDWGHVIVLFADERAVPPDHPDSNYRMVREALLDPLGARAPVTRRMRGESSDLDEAARDYEAKLIEPLDLVVLGVGEDGHIASLFPGSPLLQECQRRVAVVTDSPKPPARRLTVTPRALAEAIDVLVLAGGAAKAGAAAAALAEEGDVERCPARLVRNATWLLDTAAAP